jgi:LysM repeat protein
VAANQSNQPNQAAPTIAVAESNQPSENKPADSVVEYRAKSGDSLMKLAWRYKVSPERIKELNPNIVKWRSVQIGQRIALPSPTPANQPAPPQGELVGSANAGANTTEITVGPGDSVAKLARRHSVSPEELRKLNPTINRWPMIKIGERLTLPSPVSANTPSASQAEVSTSPATSPVQPVASTNAPAGTKVVVVGRGESLNELAQRYRITPRRLKLLNPRIRIWASIHPGQKILVPAVPGS